MTLLYLRLIYKDLDWANELIWLNKKFVWLQVYPIKQIDNIGETGNVRIKNLIEPTVYYGKLYN